MFKCHLDVGFIDTQANVVRTYFERHFPQALQTAAALRREGNDRYVWTTGSWLLYQYLESFAGEGSALHKKYGVCVQHVGIVTVPENYTERLASMFPNAYRRLLLMGLEAHDLALSKLERNSVRDREDVKYLARAVPLDLAVLESRYHSELRPYLAIPERHDLTLRLWLEMLRGG